MTTISASQLIHEVLISHSIGYQFSQESLLKLAQMRHPAITDGAVAGFINRAIRNHIVKPVHHVKGVKRRGHAIYELIGKTPWAFKPKSKGSASGRVVHKTEHTKLPIVDPNQEELSLTEPEEKDVTVNVNQEDSDIAEQRQFSVEDGSLADQLVAIAIQVAALEAREEKTIQDFTMNELIDEIKRRVDVGER